MIPVERSEVIGGCEGSTLMSLTPATEGHTQTCSQVETLPMILCCAFPKGEPLSPHQDPWGLLLLCVRPHPAQDRPRPLLCGDGT